MPSSARKIRSRAPVSPHFQPATCRRDQGAAANRPISSAPRKGPHPGKGCGPVSAVLLLILSARLKRYSQSETVGTTLRVEEHRVGAAVLIGRVAHCEWRIAV